MDLLIDDVADLMKVSRDTVTNWVEQGQIPAYQIQDQVRFNPEEIENWMVKRDPYSSQSETDKPAGTNQFIFFRALHRGQVFHEVPGDTRQEVIRETLKRLAANLEFDAEGVTKMFLDREKLMPTALNNGIAVPHTRDFKLNSHFDAVTVVYPEKLLDYEALDGKPVHTLFFLFACDDRRHLNLLAKIAHLASQESGQALLRSKPSKQNLLEQTKVWEGQL